MDINCEFDQQYKVIIGDDDIQLNLYQCTVLNSVNFKRFSKFRGEHLDEKDDDHVEGIHIEYRIAESMLRNIHRQFKNITHLEVIHCGLKKLEKRDLIGLEKLTSIIFSHNELELLPNDLFVNLRNLEIVIFDANKITHLSSELLAPLRRKNLQLISLIRNIKISACYFRHESRSEWFTTLDTCALLIRNAMSYISFLRNINKNCLNPNDYERKSEQHSKKLSEGFGELWTTGRLSDFVIKVDSSEFPVHKNILSIRSSVFASKFKCDPAVNEMTIEDFSANCVQSFLKYFYTGGISNMEKVTEMYTMATRFDVPCLKASCEETILGSLNESNAYKLFMMANSLMSENLKQKVFDEIVKMFPEKPPPRNLMDKPEILKKMLDAKHEHDRRLLKAKLEYKANMADISYGTNRSFSNENATY